jgi:hypothetical protein
MRTDTQTDEGTDKHENLTVAFRNFAKSPKKCDHRQFKKLTVVVSLRHHDHNQIERRKNWDYGVHGSDKRWGGEPDHHNTPSNYVLFVLQRDTFHTPNFSNFNACV